MAFLRKDMKVSYSKNYLDSKNPREHIHFLGLRTVGRVWSFFVSLHLILCWAIHCDGNLEHKVAQWNLTLHMKRGSGELSWACQLTNKLRSSPRIASCEVSQQQWWRSKGQVTPPLPHISSSCIPPDTNLLHKLYTFTHLFKRHLLNWRSDTGLGLRTTPRIRPGPQNRDNKQVNDNNKQ